VSPGGQLGIVASSERFKKDIATMEDASAVILSLRPVTFHYKADAKETPQFGLIAEEVAKMNPALVLPDKDGKPFTVRYEAVNAMLLNEFLKEHRKVEKLEAALDAVNQRLAEQDAKIQKVNTQLELRQSAPQTVLNNQ
jgi:predicted ribosome quality control (RQC) complex YloA/Tae2 family protein